MKFRLDYTPPECPHKIGHKHKIFLAGSCFSENVGKKLHEYRFQCAVNPGGIHFDPLNISLFLQTVLREEPPGRENVVERDGLFFSYAHHSSVYGSSRDELQKKLADIYSATRRALMEADFVFLSFGTAFIHHLQGSDLPVANCHKQPGRLFTKKLTAIEELFVLCSDVLSAIRKLNKKTRIIVTVSPVKYLRDGPVKNNLSKATLLLLANRLATERDCFYFPAFELLSDDLRDYRFYKEDLAHPNELAIEYIWEKFVSTFFSLETQQVVEEISKLNRSLAHRPLHLQAGEDESLKTSIQRQKELILRLDPFVRL